MPVCICDCCNAPLEIDAVHAISPSGDVPADPSPAATGPAKVHQILCRKDFVRLFEAHGHRATDESLDRSHRVAAFHLHMSGRIPALPESQASRFGLSRLAGLLAFVAAFGAIFAHGYTLYRALGGWQGLNSKAAILKDDHPLYLHSSVVTRTFLAQSGTTAGYDPTFMAGYAKSAVFPASSTLPELVMWACGGWAEPAVVHKWFVFLAALAAPVVVLWAASGLGGSKVAGRLAVVVWLVYVWTDFPIRYVGFGMIPYFLAIPLALATLRACVRWLDRGGFGRWLVMTLLLAATTLTHFTALMVLVPAAAAAWICATHKGRRAFGGLVAGGVAVAANVFWWWPGVVLGSTKGESGFAFAHTEGVIQRLGQIFWSEAPIEPVLILGLMAGWPLAFRANRVAAAGLAGFAAGGFFWGYGAGAFRTLDFLQPGRHTYAFYSVGSIVTACVIVEGIARLRRVSLAAGIGAGLGCCGVTVRLFGPILMAVYGLWTTPATSPLDSRPPAAYEAIRGALAGRVTPTDRVLYEEGGFGPDFFQGGRYSGVLARELGVEFLGGPYLHASLTTNVAQFGEGKLLGREDWDAAWLESARVRYGLTWIVCWSDKARSIVDAAPDRFETILRDGPLRIARAKGTGAEDKAVSPTIPLIGAEHVEGPVRASPGRIGLTVRPGAGTAVDREVVLRYHWTPNLTVSGPEGIEVVRESQNSADESLPPLIRLRLKPEAVGPVELRIGVW